MALLSASAKVNAGHKLKCTIKGHKGAPLLKANAIFLLFAACVRANVQFISVCSFPRNLQGLALRA